MKAMLLRRQAPIGSNPLEPVDIPLPQPSPGEILVRVRVCAVCRTDLHVIEGDLPSPALPLVPGHQIVGTVEHTGPDCSRFQLGDRVGIAWLRQTCGTCAFCVRRDENLCASSIYTGYHADGGYAEYAAVREDYAYAIPATFSDRDAAPLLCAGIIGFRALARCDLPAGGRLGLLGFGSSAHVVLQLARHRGSEVFVATRGESHRRLARELGADWVGDTLELAPVKLDSAIVFAPAGEIVPVALRAIGKGGTVALAGIHMSPIPRMDYEPHLFHEKNLRSVEANTRVDGEALFVEAADIPIRPTTTPHPLRYANEVLNDLKRDRINGTALLVP